DLSKYFDTIPHSELMQCMARRIVDKHMLHLVKMWLKVPVEERDEKGKKRLTGGKDRDRGTPQGGVISPLLANLYMNRMLKGWKAYFGLGNPWKAYEVLDEHVEERVRHFLRRRHKVSSQGTRQFSMRRIFGELGVFRLRGPLRVEGS